MLAVIFKHTACQHTGIFTNKIHAPAFGGLIVAILDIYICKIIRQQSNEFKGILSSFMFSLSFIHKDSYCIVVRWMVSHPFCFLVSL